jgi:hypothetical protein
MRRSSVAVVVCLLSVLVIAQQPPAQSQLKVFDSVTMFGQNGSRLLADCAEVGRLKAGDTVPIAEAVRSATSVGACSGFIAGVNDQAMADSADSRKLPYCLPDGVDMSQLIRVTKRWLENHPEQLHLPSAILVVRALSEAFPCR